MMVSRGERRGLEKGGREGIEGGKEELERGRVNYMSIDCLYSLSPLPLPPSPHTELRKTNESLYDKNLLLQQKNLELERKIEALERELVQYRGKGTIKGNNYH